MSEIRKSLRELDSTHFVEVLTCDAVSLDGSWLGEAVFYVREPGPYRGSEPTHTPPGETSGETKSPKA